MSSHLSSLGLVMRQGTIVDATIVAAPSSTKNEKKERDPEMHQTQKGNQWYHRCAEGFAYGMKIHIGVDKDSGLIHSVETTPASVHDFTQTENLLHGVEKVMYGDAGYQGVAKRPEMQGKEVEFRTSMRHGKRKQLPDTPEGHLDEWCERAKSHIRARWSIRSW